MRSSPSGQTPRRQLPVFRRKLGSVLLVLGATLAACGSDTAPEGPQGNGCETSFLTYDNFGGPFIVNWCRGCHSSELPADMRQGAPDSVNFDSAEQVRATAQRIVARAAGSTPTMPPAGGPSAAERAMLDEWVRCGAR